MDCQFLILMAGRGTRVEGLNQGVPKPLVEVHGMPLVELVVRNLTPKQSPSHFYFVCLAEHLRRFGFAERLGRLGVPHTIVPLSAVTEGAAQSAYLALAELDLEKPLVIANADQLVASPIDRFLEVAFASHAAGTIMTMEAHGEKWSYVRLGPQAQVLEVQEKVVISDVATVGVYFFRRAAFFKAAVEAMVQKNIRTNNEFYLAPSYNELIGAGLAVSHAHVGKLGEAVFGLGTAEDIRGFEALPRSRQILAEALS